MKTKLTFTLLGLITFLSGCGYETTTTHSGSTNLTSAGTSFVVDTQPAGAVPVATARQNASDGDSVAVEGYIGGSTAPFVEGLAAFTIVDPKLNYCPPEEGCPTPWDYCCTPEEDKKPNMATVQIVDADGKIVDQDARQLLAVKELSLVVVQGTAKKDAQGNFSVLATKVFVKPNSAQ